MQGADQLAATTAEEVDVLVVGAGPGGSAAAYHLAEHGANVLVVEKAAFPRDKVCGDGLTPRGVKALLSMGIDPLADPAFAKVKGLRTYGRNVRIELPWPKLNSWPDYGLVRTRTDLDHLLISRATGVGARLWERAEAVAPITDRGWVAGATVRIDEDGAGPKGTAEGGRRGKPKGTRTVEVRSRFVLAADGASSRFAGQAGVRRDPARPLGIAARRYYRLPRENQEWLESWLDLWDGDSLLPGYGWIFPVNDDVVNVGAGLLNTFKNFKDVSARRVFDIFVGSLPKEWGVTEEHATGPFQSGPLPMGFNRRPLAEPGMLVVGDAGGVANPFNGEGISYAMETGELAAELVFEALVKGRPGLAHAYPTALRQRYGRYYAVGRRFVQAIGNPTVMRAATRYGLPREWLMRLAMRVMANLTDGPDGDATDQVLYAIERLVPAG